MCKGIGQQRAAKDDDRHKHDHREHGEKTIRPAQHAPGRAGVPHVGETEEPVHYRTRFAQGKRVPYDLLADLVENRNEQG